MLEKFIGLKRVILIPAEWLNTVANIFNNIRSPKNTIIVRIEGYGEGSNMTIDLNPREAAIVLSDFLAGEFIRKGDNSLLGEGLKWTQSGVTIDKDWFRQQVIQGEKN